MCSRVTAAGSDIHALADTLAAQTNRSDPTASRGAFYTATAALNTTRIIVPTPAPVNSVALSPDGHTLASPWCLVFREMGLISSCLTWTVDSSGDDHAVHEQVEHSVRLVG